ncbi:MurR/RpiR family transcriptional regulator [[Eubacterium] hominis]|uniref:MurR/RpiR family transcriptional regulator n=1 Tax=[Eubacterium] hominis TaxID=2764325 RepID=UPI003A4D75D7
MNVKLKIKDRYQKLSKTNRRIADGILSDADRFLKMTALEAGEQYQTSSASIIRFTKTLGYKGLEEFKIALAKDQSRDAKEYDVDTIVSQDDDIATLCQKVEMLIDTTNHDLFDVLDKDVLSDAIECLSQSENIYLLGIGASMLPAYDMYHKLKRIHIKAHYEFDAHMAAEFFHYVTEKDCVVAFSYSGLSKEVIYPCSIAKEKGACIIAVTRNNAESALSKLADMILNVPDKEHLTRTGAISSKHSSMTIVDLLYLGITQKDENMFEDKLVHTSLLTRELKED